MSKREMLLTILVVVAIAVLSYGALQLVLLFWKSIQEADPSVASASIAGLAAFCLAVFAYWKERSRASKEAHRDKKIEIYFKFVDMIFSVIMANVEGKENATDEIIASEEFIGTMLKFKRDLLLYGSPNVINKFNDYMSSSYKDDEHKTDEEERRMLNAIEDLFFAIRKDIGLSNFTLQQGALHQLYTKTENVEGGES